MSGNLVYFVHQPLYDRDLERHGILQLHADGFHITVIELTEIIRPETPRPGKPARLPEDIEVIEPVNWAAFETLESNVRNADLVFLFIQSYGLSATTLRPLRMLARTGTPYAIQGTTSMPGSTHHVHRPMSQPLSTFWNRLRHMNLDNSIISRLSPKMLNIPAAKYALVPCAEEVSISGNSLVGPKTQIVPLHTSDYETFRKSDLSKVQHNSAENRKAVFVDQYTPYHIDYIHMKARPIDPGIYYAKLRAAFDAIEDKIGIQIEIAKHPRAKYENADPRFGGRPIHEGRTMEMIAESDLVLTHNSTAISFAVLMRKPIAFLNSKYLYQIHPASRASFDALSKELGSPLRMIDDLSAEVFEGLFDIDQYRYSRYAEQYLRHSKAQDRPYWDIARSFINEISKSDPALNENDVPGK